MVEFLFLGSHRAENISRGGVEYYVSNTNVVNLKVEVLKDSGKVTRGRDP